MGGRINVVYKSIRFYNESSVGLHREPLTVLELAFCMARGWASLKGASEYIKITF